MTRDSMRAVRIECPPSAFLGNPIAAAASNFITWDFRGMLDSVDGNIRIMCECVSSDSQFLPEGFSVGGVKIVEIVEEWSTPFLSHHLVILEFDSQKFGGTLNGNDITLMSGTNFTPSEGLVIQVVGRQLSLVALLNQMRAAVPVERITSAKRSDGITTSGPTLQQHMIVRAAFDNGWYEIPKKTSIRQLAKKLGLSKSTLADQLIKAESEIVGDFLGKSN